MSMDLNSYSYVNQLFYILNNIGNGYKKNLKKCTRMEQALR